MARRMAWMTAVAAMLGAAAMFAVGQTPTPSPATQPTTRQAAYDRLLGGDADRPEKPILPTGRPTIDLTTGAAAVAPSAPQVQTLREGSHIINRVGRLEKAQDGQGFEFVFNADSSSLSDPPMKVLPNLKLAVMEDTLETTGRDLQFRVTGMVTEYRGRNYILLEKVVVLQDIK